MALRPLARAPARYRVLVADHEDPVRRRVRGELERDGHFEICAETADAAAAVEEAVRSRPDVCLLETSMPGGGIQAAWEIKSRLPWTTIVMLASSRTPDDLFAALYAGASGYLPRDMNLTRLPHALADAAGGKAAIPRELVGRLVEEFHDGGPRRRVVLERAGMQLTSREWQVLDLVRLGLSNGEIADRLFVSPATVRSHLAAIRRKLAVPDRAALIALFEPELDLR